MLVVDDARGADAAPADGLRLNNVIGYANDAVLTDLVVTLQLRYGESQLHSDALSSSGFLCGPTASDSLRLNARDKRVQSVETIALGFATTGRTASLLPSATVSTSLMRQQWSAWDSTSQRFWRQQWKRPTFPCRSWTC